MAESRDVVVIGAGPAGYAAAFMASDHGRKVTMVDPEANPGGVCLYRGCIPTKALLHVVKTKREVSRAAEWGFTWQEPVVDLDTLRSWKNGVVAKLTKGVGSLARRREIEYLRGTARFDSPEDLTVSHEDGESSLRAKNIVVATGSRPQVLPMMPDDDRVWVADSALDIPSVPGRMLVVGGGYIGLEMSYIYGGLGSSIDLVEMTQGLMPGADRDLVGVFQEVNKDLFSEVLLGTKVGSVDADKDGLSVHFEGDDAPDGARTYDAILLATGRTPILDTVNVEAAGLELTDEGYIAVDEQLRSSVDHIFAVGDVAGPPLLAHKGQHEGRIAGAVLGGEDVIHDVRAMPAVEYTEPEIAWTGLTETEAQAHGIEVTVSTFPWKASGRAITMGRSTGLTKLLFDPESGRLLGAGIAGTNADEMIGEASHAIEMGATARDLELTVHAHPTLSEAIRGAAERFFGTATDI